jgi:hypothetical protein
MGIDANEQIALLDLGEAGGRRLFGSSTKYFHPADSLAKPLKCFSSSSPVGFEINES